MDTLAAEKLKFLKEKGVSFAYIISNDISTEDLKQPKVLFALKNNEDLINILISCIENRSFDKLDEEQAELFFRDFIEEYGTNDYRFEELSTMDILQRESVTLRDMWIDINR